MQVGQSAARALAEGTPENVDKGALAQLSAKVEDVERAVAAYIVHGAEVEP